MDRNRFSLLAGFRSRMGARLPVLSPVLPVCPRCLGLSFSAYASPLMPLPAGGSCVKSPNLHQTAAGHFSSQLGDSFGRVVFPFFPLCNNVFLPYNVFVSLPEHMYIRMSMPSAALFIVVYIYLCLLPSRPSFVKPGHLAGVSQ